MFVRTKEETILTQHLEVNPSRYRGKIKKKGKKQRIVGLRFDRANPRKIIMAVPLIFLANYCCTQLERKFIIIQRSELLVNRTIK